MPNVFEFAPDSTTGRRSHWPIIAARLLLVVNTASKCGFTPQYKGLEELYRRLHAQGLEILGFPCDQFGHQEPGTDADIKSFCELNYGVTFPLFCQDRGQR